MSDLVTGILTGLTGLAAFSIALFGVGRAMRSDAAKRLDNYTTRLEQRIINLEGRLGAEERRRYQLEAILRAAGIEIPAWIQYPDPGIDPGETNSGQPLFVPTPRRPS